MTGDDPLTTPILLEGLETLDNAYPRGRIATMNPSVRAGIYRDGLRGVTATAFREAVKRVIQDDVHFPKAARLREVARTIDRELIARTPRVESWDTCGLCGARVTETDIYYDVRDEATGITEARFAGRRLTMLHLPAGHNVRVAVEGE